MVRCFTLFFVVPLCLLEHSGCSSSTNGDTNSAIIDASADEDVSIGVEGRLDQQDNCKLADLSTNPEHCGACGVSCRGGECTDGRCSAVEIAREPIARGLASDDEALYWTRRNTGIMRYDFALGESTLLIDDEDADAPLLVVGGKVYWRTQAGVFEQVHAKSTDAKGDTTILQRNTSADISNISFFDGSFFVTHAYSDSYVARLTPTGTEIARFPADQGFGLRYLGAVRYDDGRVLAIAHPFEGSLGLHSIDDTYNNDTIVHLWGDSIAAKGYWKSAPALVGGEVVIPWIDEGKDKDSARLLRLDKKSFKELGDIQTPGLQATRTVAERLFVYSWQPTQSVIAEVDTTNWKLETLWKATPSTATLSDVPPAFHVDERAVYWTDEKLRLWMLVLPAK